MNSASRPARDLLQEAFLRPKEAARLSRRHYQTVLKALRSGELPGVQLVDNGSWLIKTEDVLRWVDPTYGRCRPQGRPARTPTARRAA